jgi:hypothetical protein
MADGDGVTIRRRACDSTDIDAAGCAGHVFDDQGLTECCPHMLGQNASQRIRGPPAGNGTTIMMSRDG